jgi:hypothetical protein
MKDSHDKTTPDLFPLPAPRGRPPTGTAKTTAERQAEFRRRKSAEQASEMKRLRAENEALRHQVTDARHGEELAGRALVAEQAKTRELYQRIQDLERELVLCREAKTTKRRT